jgi:hypothetical protein
MPDVETSEGAPPPEPLPVVPAPDPRPPAPRVAWKAALGVAAVLAVFFAPALLGDGDFVARDTGRMHAPTKRWIREELSRGRLPEWNPYAGLGSPVLANGLDAVQHPFTALLLALPPAAGPKAWTLLSFLLAAAGAFLWARVAGRTGTGAAVAALAFTLSGPLVSSTDNLTYLTTYAALPWLLAAAHAHAARGGPLRLLAVAGAAALCAAGGDPQAWAIAVAALPVYAVAVAPEGARVTALRRGLAAAAVAALASAPFVLPVLAWLPHTGRAAGLSAAERAQWNLHPRRLLELFVPELLREDLQGTPTGIFAAYAGDAEPWLVSVYLGVSVIALAVLGAIVSTRARLHALATLVIAWAALGAHAGFGAIAARLPVLQSFRYWEKLSIWLPLLLAPCAAAGAEALLRGEGARRLAREAAAGAAALLALAALAAVAPRSIAAVAGGPLAAAARLAENLASGAGRAGLVLALVSAVAALVARGRLGGRTAPLAIAAVVALDLFGGNAGAYVLGPRGPAGPPPLAAELPPGTRVLTPFKPRANRWPELGTPGSLWEWSRRTLYPSWNVPLRVATNLDYVGLREARWAQLSQDVSTGGHPDRLGLLGFSHLVVPQSPDLAARAGVAPPFRVVASDPELPAFLLAVPHRARAYLAAAPFQASEAEAFDFAAGGGDGRTAVEAEVPAGLEAPSGDAQVEEDLPGTVVVRATSDQRALLVLNDLFAPGWSAAVDGRSAAIVRANGVVRGVWLEPGTHEVAFRYRTPGLVEGWAIALACVLALAGWALARRSRV